MTHLLRASLLGLSVLAIAFAASSAARAASPAQIEAILIVAEYGEPTPMRVDRLRELLDAGLDVNTADEGDETLVNLAIESWAYNSNDTELPAGVLDSSKRAVQLLIERGADIDRPDASGQTPLLHLIRYGAPDVAELFDLLVARNVDFNRVLLGRNASVLVYLGGGARARELDVAIAHGLDLAHVDRIGTHVGILAAGRRPAEGQTVTHLERLLTLLAPETRARLARQPDITGRTPLMVAARAGNLAGVRYLIETMGLEPAAINAVTQEGETALSLSRKYAAPAVVAYLESKGAMVAPADPAELTCAGPNAMPLGFDRLRALIELCDLRSVEAMLPLLPRELRANYLLAYADRGILEASFAHPRTTLIGRDGKMLMSFNGHASQRGFHSIEVIAFSDATRTFEMRDIVFPGPSAPAGTRAHISPANPPTCLACHGAKPRPLWDNWTLWPGKYEGEQGRFYPGEWAGFQQYLAGRDQDARYRHLLEIGNLPARTAMGPSSSSGATTAGNPNVDMDTITRSLMGEAIARELRDTPVLRRYRYALLGALSCQADVREFLPEGEVRRLPRSIEALTTETQRLTREEFLDRIRLLTSLTGLAAPQGRYILDALRESTNYSAWGRNFDHERTVALRYLVEGNGVSMANWFTAFDPGKTRYAQTTFEALAMLAWKELLDSAPESGDAELYRLYTAAWPKTLDYGTGPYAGSFVYQVAAREAEICPLLKAKSLAALAGPAEGAK